MEARLQSSVMVSALQRRAESEGGFAAVLAKGDSQAGAILVILAERGRKARIMERVLHSDDRYAWLDVSSQTVENEEETERFLARRRKFDPDLWIIELDVASAERFAAEMNLTL
jgi:hypothetical protein